MYRRAVKQQRQRQGEAEDDGDQKKRPHRPPVALVNYFEEVEKKNGTQQGNASQWMDCERGERQQVKRSHVQLAAEVKHGEQHRDNEDEVRQVLRRGHNEAAEGYDQNGEREYQCGSFFKPVAEGIKRSERQQKRGK